MASKDSKPAEVFRKDLISAMKLPDSYQLQPGEYWQITDSWKQDWEKGVQVPVNPSAIPQANFNSAPTSSTLCQQPVPTTFKMPKKWIQSLPTPVMSEGVEDPVRSSGQGQQGAPPCQYDLDDMDMYWLQKVNLEITEMGDEPIEECVMERVMEAMERQCQDQMNHAIQTEEGLGIEYDESIICDVCRSPDCEEGNEMVFCDSCNICVHQACYGILKIPKGSWMCKTCALGIQPTCLLCPKKGGAMKSTRSSNKWAHVSCALWVPEVSIGCPEKMEPITKISHVPSSRWSLICGICRERKGACIQCSVSSCKASYHVTCGFENSLEMKSYIDNTEDVKFRSFCVKHTKKRQQGDMCDPLDLQVKVIFHSSPKKDPHSTPKKEKTQEEQANERVIRIRQLEDEFYTLVKVKDVAAELNMKEEKLKTIDYIFEYWKLKRKSMFNKPLVAFKQEEVNLGSADEYLLYNRMKMFVHLRQDLERVRNLCYMVEKREKLSRQHMQLREEIFSQQHRLLVDPEDWAARGPASPCRALSTWVSRAP